MQKSCKKALTHPKCALVYPALEPAFAGMADMMRNDHGTHGHDCPGIDNCESDHG